MFRRHRGLRRTLGATTVLVLSVLSTSAGAAVPTWSPVGVPEPTGTFSGELLGAACPTSSDCVAVGWGSSTGSLLSTLVERWNGTTWTAQTSPNPSAPGDTFPQLNAVTCVSTKDCTAVGTDLTTANDSNTVVESWNGTSWSVGTSPDVTGATDNTLSGVTCWSATLCMAVGNSVTTSPDVSSLVEQWNGTSWSIDTSPDVSGALQTILDSVSCTSATDCLAVGYSLTSSATEPVIEQWNGSTWSLGNPALPTGSADNELTGIACPRASTCDAVGRTYATNSSPAAALAEQWNGSAWSVVSTPNPTGVLGDFLTSVSCPTRTTCEAGGESYLDDSGDSQTLVEQLSGDTWSVAASPNAPGVTTSLLHAVACPRGSTSCVAAGQSYASQEDDLLALSLSGGTWTVASVSGPTTFTSAYLQGIGCSGTVCAAVGDAYLTNDFNSTGLIEQWNGTTWSMSQGAEPSGADVTALYGASCPTATTCYAVGDVGIGSAGEDGQTEAFVESWTGGSWSAVTVPEPAGPTFVRLTAISCVKATCAAVGYSEPSPGGAASAIALQLSGQTWQLEPVPGLAGATATSLAGVSCHTVKNCTAVGSYVTSEGSTQTLVAAWNGSAWTTTAGPDASGSVDDQFLGVACSSTSACTAVGSSEASDGEVSSLAALGASGMWAVQTTPDVTGAAETVLTGVACPIASSCSASGYAVDGSGDTTLLARLSGGAWSILPTGGVAGDYATGLNAVACSSAAVCTAAGSGPDGQGQDDALIEQS